MTAATDVGRMHQAAIVDRLNAQFAVEKYDVYDGQVTKAEDAVTYPYLVVWPQPATRPVITMAGYAGEASTIAQITAAGTSPADVLAALDRASAALHRWTPTIAGRRCAPVTQQPATVPPAPDPNVKTTDGGPVFYSYIVVSLYSSGASS